MKRKVVAMLFVTLGLGTNLGASAVDVGTNGSTNKDSKPISYIHPDAQKFLDATAKAPPLDTQTAQKNREDIAGAIPLTGKQTPMASVTDTFISGVSVRVYRPEGVPESAPALVYFHGGGWVIGDANLGDTTVRDIAAAAHAIAISVNYRLAPENPFPAAIDDALKVVTAVLEGKSGLAVDASRIAVGGDSAGGNIAAVVAQELRNHSPRIVHQVLIYPVTDLASMNTKSYRSFAEGHFLTARDMKYFAKQYTQSANRNDPRISPIRAKDLSGLPPTTIVLAEKDPLNDDGRAYGKALLKAGNSVSVVEFVGQVHPFIYIGSVIEDALIARKFVGRRLGDVFYP